MTHCITTSAAYNGIIPNGTAYPGSEKRAAVPTVGTVWEEPVLTVRDNGKNGFSSRQVSILFNATGVEPAVVIDPWGEPVKIAGEDLFALRELLNNLPEEAFTRPKDPEPDYSNLASFKDRHGYWGVVDLEADRFQWVILDGLVRPNASRIAATGKIVGGHLYEKIQGHDCAPIDDGVTSGGWTDGDLTILQTGEAPMVRRRTEGRWVKVSGPAWLTDHHGGNYDSWADGVQEAIDAGDESWTIVRMV